MSSPVALRVLPGGRRPNRFAARVAESHGDLRAAPVTTLQVNVGKRCNQACRHCHVDASPARTEVMPDDVVEACLDVLARDPGLETIDITGGAPEIHPRFRDLVTRARQLGRHVMVRHNLTVQGEEGQGDLAQFFADHNCEVVCSLPHYTAEATDRQRGRGVHEASLAGLQALNAVGYGRGDGLVLNLVTNPVGAFLPPAQDDLERDTREYLENQFGVTFDHLLTITNMPIGRFARWLEQAGLYEQYVDRLQQAFNPETIPALMCRTLISVGWDGRIYDCDFNQMLEIGAGNGTPLTIHGLDTRLLANRLIQTAEHCFGCTAGAGSSCGGAIV